MIQMAYLEEWSILERDYADSLSGIVEALTASILCLPVTDGAKVVNSIPLYKIVCTCSLLFCVLKLKFFFATLYLQADIQDVKNAVGSAVDIMQTIGSSICTLLAKVLCPLNCFPVPFAVTICLSTTTLFLIYDWGPWRIEQN